MEHAAHHTSAAGVALFLLLTLLPAIVRSLYLAAAWRERRTSMWSGWRMGSFVAGVVLILAAMSGPLSEWAHHDLRGYMVQHLMLGMFAPLPRALGAPGTLLLRNLAVRRARALVALLGTLPMRVVTHPVTTALLDIGGMYMLYMTPLYLLCINDPALHVFLHLHFLISGYLFTWAIAGPVPAPHPPSISAE